MTNLVTVGIKFVAFRVESIAKILLVYQRVWDLIINANDQQEMSHSYTVDRIIDLVSSLILDAEFRNSDLVLVKVLQLAPG